MFFLYAIEQLEIPAYFLHYITDTVLHGQML
jgi:hypothetical protein